MKKFLLVQATTILVMLATAQKVPLQNTLLWKVSGKGLTEDSYIYVTGKSCDDKLILSNKAKQAANDVKNIVVEYDLYGSKDAGKLAKNNLALSDSQKIKNNLSLNQIAAFETKMKDAGYPAQSIPQLQVYKLNMVYFMLNSLTSPCNVQSQGLVYEVELRSLSKKLNKTFGVIQTIDEYITEGAGANNLYWKNNISYLLDNEETVKNLLARETGLYKEANLKVLQKLYKENAFYTLFYKTPLQKEHSVFLSDKIEVGMKQGSGFFTIQLNNILYSDSSVLEILAERGYTITPVTD